MNIAIYGPIYIDIQITLDEAFNPQGANTGKAISSYYGCTLELAQQLSKRNNVSVITCLDTGFTDIVDYMQKQGIDTRFVTYECNGTGIRVNYLDHQYNIVSTSPMLNMCIDKLELHEDELDELDVMILTSVDHRLVDTCLQHNIEIICLNNDDVLDEGDEALLQEAGAKIVSNCRDVVKEVSV